MFEYLIEIFIDNIFILQSNLNSNYIVAQSKHKNLYRLKAIVTLFMKRLICFKIFIKNDLLLLRSVDWILAKFTAKLFLCTSIALGMLSEIKSVFCVLV